MKFYGVSPQADLELVVKIKVHIALGSLYVHFWELINSLGSSEYSMLCKQFLYA